MQVSSRRLAFLSYAARVILSAVLSLVLVPGPDWGPSVAQAAVSPKPVSRNPIFGLNAPQALKDSFSGSKELSAAAGNLPASAGSAYTAVGALPNPPVSVTLT